LSYLVRVARLAVPSALDCLIVVFHPTIAPSKPHILPNSAGA
jgi:hypothetical protein